MKNFQDVMFKDLLLKNSKGQEDIFKNHICHRTIFLKEKILRSIQLKIKLIAIIFFYR